MNWKYANTTHHTHAQVILITPSLPAHVREALTRTQNTVRHEFTKACVL